VWGISQFGEPDALEKYDHISIRYPTHQQIIVIFLCGSVLDPGRIHQVRSVSNHILEDKKAGVPKTWTDLSALHGSHFAGSRAVSTNGAPCACAAAIEEHKILRSN
jgi:hypothetical protein